MPVFEDTKGRKTHKRVVIQVGRKRKEWVIKGSVRDADAFEARKRVELETVGLEIRVVPTLSDFIGSHYKSHAIKHMRRRTWTNRTYTLATLVAHLGHLKLTEITEIPVEKYQSDRLRAGISASTVNTDIRDLRSILAYARQLKIPAYDFKVDNIQVKGKGRVTFWSKVQVAALLDMVAKLSPNHYYLVLFLLNTGCRAGEALAMEWSRIDLDRKIITIEPNPEWRPKNNKPREVPIAEALLPFLSSARKSPRWVFPTRKGGRYAVWPLLQFNRARKAAGLSGGPHTTRHTFASHFLADCPDLFLLARILGHSTTKVTEMYSHMLPDHLNRARGVVNFGSVVGVAELEARKRWGVGQEDAK